MNEKFKIMFATTEGIYFAGHESLVSTAAPHEKVRYYNVTRDDNSEVDEMLERVRDMIYLSEARGVLVTQVRLISERFERGGS